MFEEYECIDNIELIWNNLRHIDFELVASRPSPMRIAKESHQLLLRAMVEALRGSANLGIAGRPAKARERWYRQGDGPWYVIKKVDVAGCEKAWRYSEAKLGTPSDASATRKPKVSGASPEYFLLGFYDLLAMIQAPCFMHRFVYSHTVSVSTEEMRSLEWLHEEIRNDFEHFLPKLLLASTDDCLMVSEVCLEIAYRLIYESGNVVNAGLGELKAQLQYISMQTRQARTKIANA